MTPLVLPRQALILAGGLGTRLRPVLQDLPKPMAPVHGAPFLEHQIFYWKKQGIRTFFLSIGHLGETIFRHFGSNYGGCEIRYAWEEKPLGTGGAIRKVLASGDGPAGGLAILNGDTWYEVAWPSFWKAGKDLGAKLMLALRPAPQTGRYGGVELGPDGRISSFGVIRKGHCLVNGGCYAVDAGFLGEAMRDYPEVFSFEGDFLPRACARGHLFGNLQAGAFLDIGIPDDYRKASRLIPPPS